MVLKVFYRHAIHVQPNPYITGGGGYLWRCTDGSYDDSRLLVSCKNSKKYL